MRIFLFLFISNLLCLNINAHTNELIYIQNIGQWESPILYKADIRNGAIFLEKDRLTIHVKKEDGGHLEENRTNPRSKGQVYQIKFLNANPNTEIIGEEKTDEYFNFFLGNDKSKWKTEVGGYNEVIYKNIYPYIDLLIQSREYSPKYTFILRHGANINDIKLQFDGLESIYLDSDSSLISETIIGSIKDEKPISFLVSEGSKSMIYSNYVLDSNIVTFHVNNFNWEENTTLEIDPEIIFSTYSGSTADNFGASATFDYFGNTYGTGLVFGTGYPTTTGAYDVTFNGNTDIAITKFNVNGSARVYSTYIGGTSYDVPHSLVVDENNRLILLATTSSSNYPTTTGAFQTTFVGGTPVTSVTSLSGMAISYPNGADIAITKFNNDGTALLGSTFYGGSGIDGVGTSTSLVINYGDNIRGEVATDSFANIYVATVTTSTNLPTVSNSFKNTNSGGFDGLLLKFNGNLSTLLGMTYIGGSGDDALYNLAFNSQGHTIATGGTTSSNIATTNGVLNPTFGGNTDGLVVSLSNDLGTLNFQSYYGTINYEQSYFVDVDEFDQIYLFGQANHNATNYYNVNAAYGNNNLGQFVSIINPTFTTKVRSTTFGSGNQAPDISPTAFLVDYCDKIYMVGWGSTLGSFNTYSLSTTGLPITSNAFQSTSNGNGFYLMILEGDLSALYYGTYFGGQVGTIAREHVDGGTSRFDKNGIVYHAVCAGCGQQQNLPIYPNASSVVSGTNNSNNCNLGVFKFDFGLPVTANFATSTTCAPGNVVFQNLSHTVSNTATYQWLVSNGLTSTQKDPTFNFTTGGVYTVRLIVTDTASCNVVDTIIKEVIVLGNPNASTLPEKHMCQNSSVRIGFAGSIDPTLSIIWTPSNTLDDNTVVAPYASPTSNTLYKAVISKGGCSDTFYQRVIIDSINSLEIFGDSSYCENSNITVTATHFSKGNYIWSPTNTLVSSNRDTAVFNFPSLPATINLEYISEGGCSKTVSKTVSKKIVTMNQNYGDSIVCAKDIIRIISSPNESGGVYTYYPDSIIRQRNGDTVWIKIDTPVSFRIYYEINPSCFAWDTINFNTLQNLIELKADSILCKNQDANASVVKKNEYNISWQPSTFLTSTQGVTPAKFNFNNIDTFIYVTATHINKPYCIVKDSARVQFIENNIKINGDNVVCRGDTVRYSSPYFLGNYNWSSNSASLFRASDSSATFVFDTSGYIYLEFTLNTGCIAKDSLYIRVRGDSIRLTTEQVICTNQPFIVKSTLIDSASYLWFPFSNIIGSNDKDSVEVTINNDMWFYLQIQDSTGCYFLDSIYLRIDTLGKVKADFSSTTGCNSDSIVFTNQTQSLSSSLDYLWDFNGEGTSTLRNPKFSFSSGGKKSIKLISTDNLNCFTSDTIVKEIYVLSNSYYVLPSDTVCRFDSVVLGFDAINDPSLIVRWTPNDNLSDSTSIHPTGYFVNSVTYTVYLSKNGCTDTINQTILVDSLSFMELTGDTVACAKSALLYNATPYTSGVYKWFPTNLIQYQNRDSAIMLIQTNQQKIIVQYTSTSGCVSQDSLIVRTVPVDLLVTMDSILCLDEVIPIYYTYQPPRGTITISPITNILSQDNDSATYEMKGDETLTLVYKINNACIDKETRTVREISKVIDWRVDSIICKGDSTVAFANTKKDYTIQWSPTNILHTPQNSSPALFGPIVSSETIRIDATTNRKSCNFKDSATIQFLEDEIGIIADSIVCANTFVELNATPEGQVKYIWGPISQLANENGSKAIFNITNSGYFYVTVYDNSGCALRDSVYINTLQDLLTLTSDSITCVDSSATLSMTYLPDVTYLWSTGETTNSITHNLSQSTQFYVTVEDANGCVVIDSAYIYTLDESTFFILTTDTIICAKDSVYINASKLPKIQYNWAPASSISTGQSTSSITGWIDVNTTYYVTATLTSPSCFVTDSITLVKDTQYLELTAPSISCRYDTVTVLANYNSNFAYNWSTSSLVDDDINKARYYLENTTMVYCTALSSKVNICKYNDSVLLDYSRYLDNLDIYAVPAEVEYNFPTQLYSVVDNAVAYLWTPAELLDNQYIPKPKTGNLTDTTLFILTVTDPVGCKSTDSVVVPIVYEDCFDPEVYVPTGFTPNGDSKNDVLYVRGDNILRMHFEIYDRWGQLMFSTNDKNIGWDGTYKGKEMEPAVFAYQLFVECIGGATYTKKGNITLIK